MGTILILFQHFNKLHGSSWKLYTLWLYNEEEGEEKNLYKISNLLFQKIGLLKIIHLMLVMFMCSKMQKKMKVLHNIFLITKFDQLSKYVGKAADHMAYGIQLNPLTSREAQLLLLDQEAHFPFRVGLPCGDMENYADASDITAKIRSDLYIMKT